MLIFVYMILKTRNIFRTFFGFVYVCLSLHVTLTFIAYLKILKGLNEPIINNKFNNSNSKCTWNCMCKAKIEGVDNPTFFVFF